MTGGFDGATGTSAVGEDAVVLLVGGDDALAERVASRLSSSTLDVTVRTVGDRTDVLEAVADVDCVVSTAPLGDDEFLEAVRARDPRLPFVSYAPVDDVAELLDALAMGFTDVVPREGETSVGVLAKRVTAAVEGARVRERASAQATALRAERDRFAALFEHIPEPTVFYEIVDGRPVTTDVNPAFESVFGYDAETLQGDVVDDYIVPESKANEAATLNDRIADGEHLDLEVRRATADGEREFLLRDVPVPESDGMRGYAIYTDITTQREREDRLREATSRLEAQNERLEAFTGVVSHDLRHPLSVAMTYTELLKERHDDEDLEALDGALARMDDLIQDLLALAQQGTDAQDRQLLGLADVARDAWSAVDTETATLDVSLGDAAVRADESRLRQLFENLFANSVEHGSTSNPMQSDDSVEHGQETSDDRGGLVVTVGVIDDDDRRGFYVADDGVGIPADERDRVLEQGYSGGSGTGFGLAIVDAVADAHDWTVTVESSVDGGVRFAFTDVDLVT
ncbi:PAS domain S-box protein [Halorubellus sp. JP-L1]|uniref:sensor histidine kinase n=1 Tax=Halorubellus sp. JP-L1 TaxID=2715753 RepID=UPI0014091178|nr:ATP-binding protein [Halorubellus sp. JP-L1]NHN42533.1 PAS domain S-box protein [Halorubellus sp. JP-L1]